MKSTPDLKAVGLKATLPRLEILKIFESRAKDGLRHLTAEDVYRLLRAGNIDAGLATVYRALTQFEQAGVLQRLNFDNGKAVFELNRGGHHDHILCLDCGAVKEFHDAEIERLQERAAKARQFKLAAHSLCLYGHCTKTKCPNRPAPAAAGKRG